MNIKRYIATIILAIVLLLNFSCTDWLDVKPVDRMSEDQLYSTEAGLLLLSDRQSHTPSL